ncbi:unnamed protein product [Meganyctiphanes norvegica]|uniref:C3H1-type domain-containing protein n=1 Tax=Meganyctiphanes norvegica TaxID=48144 RepID=A0AAV2RMW3_MEGNR
MKIQHIMETWNDKDGKLRQAITFLNERNRKIEEKMEKQTQGDLVNWLIYSLHKRMPKKCEECKDWYHTNIGDKPKLRCILCNNGNHGCVKIIMSKTIKGLSWVCPECNKTVEDEQEYMVELAKEDIMNKNRKNTGGTNNTVEPNLRIPPKTNQYNEIKIHGKRKRDEKELDEIIVLAEIHEERGNEINNIGHPNYQDQETARDPTNIGRGSTQDTHINVSRKKTCIHWVKHDCKRGNECWYDHPELCNEIITTGICKNRGHCRKYHPKMCENIDKIGYCPRGRSCYYRHQEYIPNRHTEPHRHQEYIPNRHTESHRGQWQYKNEEWPRNNERRNIGQSRRYQQRNDINNYNTTRNKHYYNPNTEQHTSENREDFYGH